MKKIIFAALLSLTAILVIASCSSEAVKTDYQAKINALISNYVDSSEAVSSQPDLSSTPRKLASNTNYIYVNTSDTDKIVVKMNNNGSTKSLSYIFTSGTSTASKFTWDASYPKADLPMEYFSVFKDKFEGKVVNALGYTSLKEAETYIAYLMKNNSSKSALKSSLSVASLNPEAVKKSAFVLANLSSDSDLIVKSDEMKQHKSEKKLAACTSALDLCYDYFSKIAEKDAPTKGDQLVVELALSYVGGIVENANGYADALVDSITQPELTMKSILGKDRVKAVILRAQYLDVITELNIAQYVATVLDEKI